MIRACLYVFDQRLLVKGRGVFVLNLTKKDKKYEEMVGWIRNITANGPPGQPSYSRTYVVQLRDERACLSLRWNQLRMVPLNDPRHWEDDMEFEAYADKLFLADKDPEWCLHQRQYTPLQPGYKWEYLDIDGKWKQYKKSVQYEIECLYDLGGEHFLYRPGAPHCEGMHLVSSLNIDLPFVGNPWFANQHDAVTRQIVFSDTRKTMTERDLYTGMMRQVRRIGPKLSARDNPDKVYSEAFHWKDNSKNDGSFCGLCFKTEGPFVKTECCWTMGL